MENKDIHKETTQHRRPLTQAQLEILKVGKYSEPAHFNAAASDTSKEDLAILQKEGYITYEVSSINRNYMLITLTAKGKIHLHNLPANQLDK